MGYEEIERNKMIAQAKTNKQNCCGCGACAQACPVGCITMTADGEGFLYPQVDAACCVDCGACSRACPIINRGEKPSALPAVYAAIGKDEEARRTSSSGGVFSLLAEHILAKGGAVFGAAFAEDWSVHHIMIDSAETLPLLKGSKYLQSRIEDTYRQAEAVLRSGRPVLFTGTGCQIAGLKSYLKKDYENLYTTDVFCHGVPSPKVWEKYLQTQKDVYNDKINDIQFRYKNPSWHEYSVRLAFENGQEYCKIHGEDIYIKLFLSEICLRPSCYDCKFRESRSGADLTIGDAWGVEEWMPDMDDNKGTSVVVANTEKGRALWEAICPAMHSRQGDAETILGCNAMYYTSVKPHPNRARFFEAFQNGASMDELVALCKKPLWRRCLSFGKRCMKKVLKLCGVIR